MPLIVCHRVMVRISVKLYKFTFDALTVLVIFQEGHCCLTVQFCAEITLNWLDRGIWLVTIFPTISKGFR